MHVQHISRVSLSAGGNRLCHLQEEIIDFRSDQFLAVNNNDCFFCYQRKFSNTVTSEMLCIGRKSQRKSQRSAWWPKPEMWPIELFWGSEVRAIPHPPTLSVQGLSSLHSVALLRTNSKGNTPIQMSSVFAHNPFGLASFTVLPVHLEFTVVCGHQLLLFLFA